MSASLGLILHGPPGTGKSTFAYRIAHSLCRHIVSLCLSDFINHKDRLYEIFFGETDHEFTTKNTVFILEEFDEFIDAIENQTISVKTLDKSIQKINMNSENSLSIQDMLQILQGPVPNDGMIIIATTNHFEKIREKCPALVRPGRLTPYLFDYLDWGHFSELVEFFFGCPPTMDPVKISLSTAEITQIAIACQNLPEGFEIFQNKMKNMLILQH